MAAIENIEFENTQLTDDALDRRAALADSVSLASAASIFSREHDNLILVRAEAFYRWLRLRDTLKPSLTVSAGTPEQQGARP